MSRILFTGGSASVHAGIPPPWEQTPPRSRPPAPGSRHPQDQAPPGEDTPRSRHPPTRHPPGSTHPPGTRHPPLGPCIPPYSVCWEIWSTSRWYASYWNAILLTYNMQRKARLLKFLDLNDGNNKILKE